MEKNRTKENILLSFNEILKENNFEKITVEEICKKSNISRSTFYRYFIDKFDVMNYNYKKLLNDVFKFELCHNWRELIYTILANSKLNSYRFVNAFELAGIPNSYPGYLANFSIRLIGEVMMMVRGVRITEEEYAESSLFCYGLTWTVYDWVIGRIKLNIDELSDVLSKTVPEFLIKLWDSEKLIKADIIEKVGNLNEIK